MLETSARLLRLLSLLQGRRDWTGPELARRLGVTTRTVRTDVGRLRTLGYPVHATPGAAGGYRLGAGAALPPLLLDDEEAVAVAVGLRTAAGATVTGIEETSLRALAKLEQVLPPRLRHRVDALSRATVAVPRTGPRVDPEVLATLAAACRDRVGLRFGYRGHDGTEAVRRTEPYRVVHTGGRWYLVAWDLDRADWRTFRADRIEPRVPNGPRFDPRDPPDGDLVTYLLRGLGSALWRLRVRVVVHAPAEEVTARIPVAAGVVTPLDEHSCMSASGFPEGAAPKAPGRCCRLVTGADTVEQLALHLGLLGCDFHLEEGPDEVLEGLRQLGERFLRASRTM